MFDLVGGPSTSVEARMQLLWALTTGTKIKLEEKRVWTVKATTPHLALLTQKRRRFRRAEAVVVLDFEHATRYDGIQGIGGGDMRYFWVLTCTEQDRPDAPMAASRPWGIDAGHSRRLLPLRSRVPRMNCA